jgi:hypothetical protein
MLQVRIKPRFRKRQAVVREIPRALANAVNETTGVSICVLMPAFLTRAVKIGKGLTPQTNPNQPNSTQPNPSLWPHSAELHVAGGCDEALRRALCPHRCLGCIEDTRGCEHEAGRHVGLVCALYRCQNRRPL